MMGTRNWREKIVKYQPCGSVDSCVGLGELRFFYARSIGTKTNQMSVSNLLSYLFLVHLKEEKGGR